METKMSIDKQVNECYDVEGYKDFQVEQIRKDIPASYYTQDTIMEYIRDNHLKIRKEYCYNICEYGPECILRDYLTQDKVTGLNGRFN